MPVREDSRWSCRIARPFIALVAHPEIVADFMRKYQRIVTREAKVAAELSSTTNPSVVQAHEISPEDVSPYVDSVHVPVAGVGQSAQKDFRAPSSGSS